MFFHVTLVVCVLKSTDKTIIGVKQNVKESIDERKLIHTKGLIVLGISKKLAQNIPKLFILLIFKQNNMENNVIHIHLSIKRFAYN